jgi:hypothetical protein
VDHQQRSHNTDQLHDAGSAAERAEFQRLQVRLAEMFRNVFPDECAPRTVVVLPSLSLDQEVMSRITGVTHYEQRMLCLLLLLRMPRTRVIFLSSEPIADPVIDYYLHLLPGIPARHARERLTILCCHDGSARPLTEKILERPRLVQRICDAITDLDSAHLTCFNVSELERTLAVRLGVPIYGCDPDLLKLGSKSGARKLFRETGVLIPAGYEDLRDAAEIAGALADLRCELPTLRRAVVKLNEGFSGEGNAVFSFDGAPELSAGSAELTRWVRERLPFLGFEASGMTWETYQGKVHEMQAIVESFIEGDEKRSPSSQYRVDPTGDLSVISTHDQVLGGETGQIFLGCRFPADEEYRVEIQDVGRNAAEALRDAGVLGRFGIDFISVREPQGWKHYAIEVNLRKGGTTHPYLMLQFLTDGTYDEATGTYRAPSGRPCCYYASDNIQSAQYRGLSPDDLIDIAAMNDLHFHSAAQQGVVFHMIGALSEFGKLGIVCVDDTVDKAQQLYHQTIHVLDRETGARPFASRTGM